MKGKRAIEEENQNAGIEGEKGTVGRRHRVFDVPSFSPFPLHRKDRVTQQVNCKEKGDPGRDRRAAGGGEGTREATRISEGRRRDENHLNVGRDGHRAGGSARLVLLRALNCSQWCSYETASVPCGGHFPDSCINFNAIPFVVSV